MELKQVIEKILPDYERALVDMPKEGHFEWLRDRDMDCGICFYAKHKLNEGIYFIMGQHVIELIGDGCPDPDYTYSENLQQIQNRVDWMREYLQKNLNK